MLCELMQGTSMPKKMRPSATEPYVRSMSFEYGDRKGWDDATYDIENNKYMIIKSCRRNAESRAVDIYYAELDYIHCQMFEGGYEPRRWISKFSCRVWRNGLPNNNNLEQFTKGRMPEWKRNLKVITSKEEMANLLRSLADWEVCIIMPEDGPDMAVNIGRAKRMELADLSIYGCYLPLEPDSPALGLGYRTVDGKVPDINRLKRFSKNAKDFSRFSALTKEFAKAYIPGYYRKGGRNVECPKIGRFCFYEDSEGLIKLVHRIFESCLSYPVKVRVYELK